MKRLKKFLIALTSLFSVVALFPLSACSGGAMHTLTLVNENEDGGTLTGEGTYKTGSQVTVSYTANNGYKFDHWDIDGETIKTSNRIYTFKMPDKDITVTGGFIAKIYKVDLDYNIWGGGELTGEGEYAFNSEVTVSSTLNKGYAFVGWYDDNADKMVSSDIVYTFKMPAKDLDLVAWYEQTKYNVTIVTSHPDIVTASISSSYYVYNSTYSVSYKINNPAGEHYSFYGLYEYVNGQKGELLSRNNFFIMLDHDLTIYLEIKRDYRLEVKDGSIIDHYGDYVFPDEEVTLKCYESNLASFLGWYDENDELISTESPYTFKMPSENIKIVGKYDIFGKSVTFGKYPQSRVKDDDLANILLNIKETNSKGYIEYENKEYKHVKDRLGDSFYLVEPIKWMPFKTNDPNITGFISAKVIDYQFTTESDVENCYFLYSDSDTRKYLNTDFISKAFTSEEQSKLLEVSVDAESSYKIVDKSTYEFTYFTDKVFVPGCDDMCGGRNKQLFPQDSFSYYFRFGYYSEYVGYKSNSTTLFVNLNISACDFLARNDGLDQYYYDYDGSLQKLTLNYSDTLLELRPIIYMRGV